MLNLSSKESWDTQKYKTLCFSCSNAYVDPIHSGFQTACSPPFLLQSVFLSQPVGLQSHYVMDWDETIKDGLWTLFCSKQTRASDISRGRGPSKFRYFREIPRNSQKNTKYREIRQKYFQIHVGKTYLILILAIRPVLFTPNVQIYLETSSLQ